MLIQNEGGHPAEIIKECGQSLYMQMPESQRVFVGATTKPLFFGDSTRTQNYMVLALESLEAICKD